MSIQKVDIQNIDKIDLDRFNLYRGNTISLFVKLGVVCKHCGREGKYVTMKSPYKLYSEDGRLITIDHVIPLSLGGKDKISNMQTLCYECNNKKGNNFIG